MHRRLTLAAAVLLPVLLGTGWAGEQRRVLLGDRPVISVTPVLLDDADPARRRVGALTFLGGVELTSPDRAFGSFSALAVAGDRFLLLSDGGNIVRFRLDARWRLSDIRFDDLPAGPRTGWEKRDRDSESLARDPRTGRVWVGFEGVNEIWRYGVDGVARARPVAIATLPSNGGLESLVRLSDGRFVALGESPPRGGSVQEGLVWAGDPVAQPKPAIHFRYHPATGYYPADITQLPDGRLLVLERALFLPFRWAVRLVAIELSALRPGADVRGREIATLAAPLIHENFEGLAAQREGNVTILWIVSDDNWLPIQRTLLLKFRLDG